MAIRRIKQFRITIRIESVFPVWKLSPFQTPRGDFQRWFQKLFQVSIFSIKIHLCLIQSIFDTRTIKISSCCFFVYLNLLKGKKLRWKLLIFINMLKTVDLEQITSAFYAINCRVSNMRKKCLFILLCNIFKYISLFSKSSLLYCWLSLSTM